MVYPPVESGHTCVAIDFDGVLADDVWPKNAIGQPLDEGVSMVKHYFDLGFQIVIYTARPFSHADAIWEWLDDHNLSEMVYDVVCNKPIAGLYIDDRAYKFESKLHVYVHKDLCDLTKTGECTCR